MEQPYFFQQYITYLSDEVWNFIAVTQSCYPENTGQLALSEQRTAYNRMCQQFHVGHPVGLIINNNYLVTTSHHIPIRHYQCNTGIPSAQILYFHGGGFVFGGLDSHDDVCAELCFFSGYPVTSVDYRLAPEHVFPAALDDAWTAYQSLVQSSQLPIILVGDSAGAFLAATVAHKSRTFTKQALGQVLIYPVLGHDFSQGSYLQHALAPMLSTAEMLEYRNLLFATPDAYLTAFSPLIDPNFSDLPNTWVFSAECDPVADDGKHYCQRIQAAGGLAHYHKEPGLVHGYLRARHSVALAQASFSRIINALQQLAASTQPKIFG